MQCSRKFLFVDVVCSGRFLQSCWWWRWYLPLRLCTQFVCVVVISLFHFVHGCWECIEHIWPMERRLGANVVRESWMSRRTKKYLVVYFLVFYSRRGERWKDVHENEPTLKVYTATKRWRSSCFQSGTWLKVMIFCVVILFRFCFCSLIIICLFFILRRKKEV